MREGAQWRWCVLCVHTSGDHCELARRASPASASLCRSSRAELTSPSCRALASRLQSSPPALLPSTRHPHSPPDSSPLRPSLPFRHGRPRPGRLLCGLRAHAASRPCGRHAPPPRCNAGDVRRIHGNGNAGRTGGAAVLSGSECRAVKAGSSARLSGGFGRLPIPIAETRGAVSDTGQEIGEDASEVTAASRPASPCKPLVQRPCGCSALRRFLSCCPFSAPYVPKATPQPEMPKLVFTSEAEQVSRRAAMGTTSASESRLGTAAGCLLFSDASHPLAVIVAVCALRNGFTIASSRSAQQSWPHTQPSKCRARTSASRPRPS